MDVTGHLEAALDAAVALADAFGPEHTRGRPTPRLDTAEQREAVEAALRLVTSLAPRVDDASLARLTDGAERLYEALAALVDGEHAHAAEVVNGLLRASRAEPWLVQYGDEPWHLYFGDPSRTGAERWLADLTTAVAMLAGGDGLSRLRRCEAERCELVFLDATKSQNRRFCSTACQNRTKVAAYRSRAR
ncbi:CGNR zinc finger domain-containing protein [Phytomonospora sp. NPDC050363]|uniref:CGNR zinc finger domain-containing protein n=1 Tax=Phytomonospora sp. NPDC050363 TaxID=3155642 RepID=UPI0033CC6995